MNRLITICALLLAVQLGLAAWTHLRVPGDAAGPVQGAVLAVDAAAVDELRLEDHAGATLVLKKAGEGWVLPGLADFPADTVRVQALVERLASLQRGWPEATTVEAAARFQVAADRFERRLTLRGGGKDLGRVFLGGSAGLRRVYLRAEGDQDIFAVELAGRDQDLDANSWIDTAVLRLTPDQVARIDLPGFSLIRHNDALVVEGLGANEEMVAASRDSLVERITTLAVRGVLTADDPAAASLDNPMLRLTVHPVQGEVRDYRFGQVETPPVSSVEGQEPQPAPVRFVLQVSNHAHLFEVDSWQVEEIRHLNRAALVQVKTAPAATAPAPAQAAPPAGAQ
jgi:hypothetical protein